MQLCPHAQRRNASVVTSGLTVEGALMSTWTFDDIPDQTGRTVIVTNTGKRFAINGGRSEDEIATAIDNVLRLFC